MKKQFFTEKDVELLRTREKLQQQLKALDAELKPKINQACMTLCKNGGTLIQVGKHEVALSMIKATTTSWKNVAYAVAPEEEILQVKDIYSTERITKTAKIVK